MSSRNTESSCPNDTGKTTIIQIFTWASKARRRKSLVAGYDVAKNPGEAKQYIGVVPEVSNTYINLTVWGTLTLIDKLYGVPKQKLLLCMALVNYPEVLFCDEPASGLDVENARLLREKNRTIQ